MTRLLLFVLLIDLFFVKIFWSRADVFSKKKPVCNIYILLLTEIVLLQILIAHVYVKRDNGLSFTLTDLFFIKTVWSSISTFYCEKNEPQKSIKNLAAVLESKAVKRYVDVSQSCETFVIKFFFLERKAQGRYI